MTNYKFSTSELVEIEYLNSQEEKDSYDYKKRQRQIRNIMNFQSLKEQYTKSYRRYATCPHCFIRLPLTGECECGYQHDMNKAFEKIGKEMGYEPAAARALAKNLLI